MAIKKNNPELEFNSEHSVPASQETEFFQTNFFTFLAEQKSREERAKYQELSQNLRMLAANFLFYSVLFRRAFLRLRADLVDETGQGHLWSILEIFAWATLPAADFFVFPGLEEGFELKEQPDMLLKLGRASRTLFELHTRILAAQTWLEENLYGPEEVDNLWALMENFKSNPLQHSSLFFQTPKEKYRVVARRSNGRVIFYSQRDVLASAYGAGLNFIQALILAERNGRLFNVALVNEIAKIFDMDWQKPVHKLNQFP